MKPEVRSRICTSIDEDVPVPDDFLAKPSIKVVWTRSIIEKRVRPSRFHHRQGASPGRWF